MRKHHIVYSWEIISGTSVVTNREYDDDTPYDVAIDQFKQHLSYWQNEFGVVHGRFTIKTEETA